MLPGLSFLGHHWPEHGGISIAHKHSMSVSIQVLLTFAINIILTTFILITITLPCLAILGFLHASVAS